MSTERIKGLRSGGYDQLVGRFAERAFMDGAAQAAYGQVPSPIGELMAVVTRRGLVALAFDSEPHDQVLNAVAKKVSPAIIDLPSAISDIRHQLDAYFTGSLRFFDIPLDRALLTRSRTRCLPRRRPSLLAR